MVGRHLSLRLAKLLRGFALVALASLGLGFAGGLAQAADTIKICIIDDATGDFAIPQIPRTHGFQLAVEDINKNGGVLGKQLQLVIYDGQSDVKRYQELALKCTLDDKVAVMFAGYTSSEREAARAVAVKNKTIYWHNNQGEGGIADHYSFFTGPVPEQQVLPGVEYMIKKFGKRAYLLHPDYGFGHVNAVWVHVAMAQFGGEVVGEEYIPLGNSDFAATIANIQKAKPDWLGTFLVGGNQQQYYPQAHAAGVKLPMFSTVNLQQGYEHKRFPPPLLANMFVPTEYQEELPTEGAKAFRKLFRAKFPDEPYINELARCAWVGIHLMAEAWERAGTTETEATISALQSGLFFDAPEGRVFLDPATHHLTMHMYLARVTETHDLEWPADFGPIEPWWLRAMGVNLVRHDDAKQYFPWDYPRFAKYAVKK
jgi:urea transport system substrate-binding protein